MVCVQLRLLPHSSVAVQMRAMTLAPAQLLLTESAKVMMTDPQPSVAVATPVTLVVGRAGHCSTMLEGQVMVGGVVSRTVIVCTQLALLPHRSVAVQVREITRVLAQLVTTWSLKLTMTCPQSSVAVATPVTLV